MRAPPASSCLDLLGEQGLPSGSSLSFLPASSSAQLSGLRRNRSGSKPRPGWTHRRRRSRRAYDAGSLPRSVSTRPFPDGSPPPLEPRPAWSLPFLLYALLAFPGLSSPRECRPLGAGFWSVLFTAHLPHKMPGTWLGSSNPHPIMNEHVGQGVSWVPMQGQGLIRFTKSDLQSVPPCKQKQTRFCGFFTHDPSPQHSTHMLRQKSKLLRHQMRFFLSPKSILLFSKAVCTENQVSVLA